MAWGCMSATSVGNICFLRNLINGAVYQDVLDHFLVPYTEVKFGNNEFIFQHDLAPLHTAQSIKEWFREKRILFLMSQQIAQMQIE